MTDRDKIVSRFSAATGLPADEASSILSRVMDALEGNTPDI